MTDEISFRPGGYELFRWDKDGNLVYVHNSIQEYVDRRVEARTAELANELSLLASIQRTCIDLDRRVQTLEQRYAELLQTLTSAAPLEKFRVVCDPLQTAVPFGSIDNLVGHIESMFDCRDGDHRGCHQVWNVERGTFDQHEYQMLGLIAASSIPNARERLRQSVYAAFLKLKQTCKSARPVLYWRYAKEVRILEDTEYGGREQTRYKISTRVAIPEADFNAAEDIIKVERNRYRELKG
jgi:hypothetical protein